MSADGVRTWGQLFQNAAGQIGVGTANPTALLEVSSSSDGSNAGAPSLRLAQASVITRRRRLADASGASVGDTKIEFGEYYGNEYVLGASLTNSRTTLKIDSGRDANAALSLNRESAGRTVIGGGGGRVCIMCVVRHILRLRACPHAPTRAAPHRTLPLPPCVIVAPAHPRCTTLVRSPLLALA